MRLRFVLLMLASPLTVHASCRDLAAAVNEAHKEIAALEASVVIRQLPPAAEAIVRQRQGNQLAAINANLLLMDRAKCPMPQEPITGDGAPYSSAANRCAAPGRDENACQRDTWKRNP